MTSKRRAFIKRNNIKITDPDELREFEELERLEIENRSLMTEEELKVKEENIKYLNTTKNILKKHVKNLDRFKEDFKEERMEGKVLDYKTASFLYSKAKKGLKTSSKKLRKHIDDNTPRNITYLTIEKYNPKFGSNYFNSQNISKRGGAHKLTAFEMIGLNASFSKIIIGVDIDEELSIEDILYKGASINLFPNYVVHNKDNKKCHLIYVLETRLWAKADKQKKSTAIIYFKDIAARLTYFWKGDPSYSNLYVKNPFCKKYKKTTTVITEDLYKLETLAERLPKIPFFSKLSKKIDLSEISSRNVFSYRKGLSLAFSYCAKYDTGYTPDVDTYIRQELNNINKSFAESKQFKHNYPMGEKELVGIANSIIKKVRCIVPSEMKEFIKITRYMSNRTKILNRIENLSIVAANLNKSNKELIPLCKRLKGNHVSRSNVISLRKEVEEAIALNNILTKTAENFLKKLLNIKDRVITFCKESIGIKRGLYNNIKWIQFIDIDLIKEKFSKIVFNITARKRTALPVTSKKTFVEKKEQKYSQNQSLLLENTYSCNGLDTPKRISTETESRNLWESSFQFLPRGFCPANALSQLSNEENKLNRVLLTALRRSK